MRRLRSAGPGRKEGGEERVKSSAVRGRLPSIQVFNRQRSVPIDLPWVRGFARAALVFCRTLIRPRRGSVLARLPEIEVTLVSDRMIAKLHAAFMNIDGPTDVLTFPHGEIIISAETARANAARFQSTLTREIALYTVHGLLHLNGFEDATRRGAAEMRATQTRVLKATLAQLAPPSAL